MSSFDYAVLRVVPRVDREEFLNAGVILHCLEQQFLGARIAIAEERLRAVWPNMDVAVVRAHLEAILRICEGTKTAGPIAQLSKRERFHWLVAPRSTMIQVSAVHSGLCEDAEAKLNQLFEQLTEA